MSEFHVSINDGPEQTIKVATGVYKYAASAALAILGHDARPAKVKIWVPDLIADYGPYNYYIDQDNQTSFLPS